MIVPREIRQKYDEELSTFLAVENKVCETLQPYCSSNGYIFDARRKSLDSLAEKIETGRFEMWSQLDDLFGCTIAIPLPGEENQVLSYLSEVFEEVEVKKRLSAKKAPDVFRFDSTRFIGRLRKPEGSDLDGGIFSARFEIQVKTLFDLAWARTTHALVYKASEIDWRALRLAAMLKASVEQMDLLLSDFQNAMQSVGEAKWDAIERKTKIQGMLAGLRSKIPTEAWPKDVSRFVDNCYSLIEAFQQSERRTTRNWDLDFLPIALANIEAFFQSFTYDTFPRSISLFQIVLCALSKNFKLPTNGKFWYPVSTEMEELFPHTKEIIQRFKFT